MLVGYIMLQNIIHVLYVRSVSVGVCVVGLFKLTRFILFKFRNRRNWCLFCLQSSRGVFDGSTHPTSSATGVGRFCLIRIVIFCYAFSSSILTMKQ